MKPEEIKNIRNSLSLTQERFAHVIGVTFATINRWERGASKPSPLALEKIKSLALSIENE